MKECPQCSNALSDDKQKCDVCGYYMIGTFANMGIAALTLPETLEALEIRLAEK